MLPWILHRLNFTLIISSVLVVLLIVEVNVTVGVIVGANLDIAGLLSSRFFAWDTFNKIVS